MTDLPLPHERNVTSDVVSLQGEISRESIVDTDQIVAAVVLGALASLLAFTGAVTALGLLVHRSETIEALIWASSFAVAAPLGVFLTTRLISSKSNSRPLAEYAAPSLALTGLLFVVTRSLALDAAYSGSFLVVFIPIAGLIYLARTPVGAWLDRGGLHPLIQGLLVILGLVCITISFLPEGAVSLVSALIAAFIAGCALGLGAIQPSLRLGRRTNLALTVSTAAVLGLWVWDISFRPNPYDQNFFLGPVIDLHHGRFMLVEVYSQYGVGVMYFLDAILGFLGLGYGSMLLLVGVCTAIGTIAMFTVLRIATGSLLWATAGAFCAAVAGPIATLDRSFQYPSTGFLRFGTTWLLVLALVITYRTDRLRWRPMMAACMVLAISSIWSFEAAFYSGGTFVVTVVAVAWSRRRFADAVLPLAAGTGTILVSLFLFVAVTAIGRGEIPNVGGYLDFIRLYSSSGFGTLPFEDWSLGYLIAALYVVSFIGVAAAIHLAPRSRFCLPSTIVPLVATTTFGALAFTYFLGRSHPNNLTHIAPPFVIMISLWASLGARRWRKDHKFTIGAAVTVVIWTGALLTVGQWNTLVEKSGDSALSAVLSPVTTSSSFFDEISVLRSNPPVTEGAKFIDQLVGQYVPTGDPILVLVDPRVLTESLMLMDRSNAIPLTTPGQDGLLPIRRNELIEATASIPCGTWIVTQNAPFAFVQSDELNLLNGILRSLESNFRLESVTTIDGGRYRLSRARCLR